MRELIQILKNTRQHLMTGVSHMIPFVVAGGILLAASVMIYGKGAAPETGILKDLFTMGVAGLTLMVPILAAYIGYSIADRSALAPAAIAAWVAQDFKAGFFGAIVAGLLAGIVVYYLKKIPVPKIMRSVMPIFIIPVVGTFICAGAMMWLFAEPVGALTVNMTEWLKGMQGGSIILLSIVLGMMIAFDMGGPVNKVAYSFMVLCAGQQIGNIVAIIAAAIAIPALACGFATLFARKFFTVEEQEAGKASLLMGCVGITEGAIPFAAADPLRVIPAMMTGAAVGSVVVALTGASSYAAWGGFIVLPVVTGKLGFIFGTLVGSFVSAALLVLLKKIAPQKGVSTKEDDDDELDLDIEIG